MINPEASQTDLDLEARIDHQALLLHTGKTREERLAAWIMLTKLHAMRTPKRVAEMEREAGLAQ